MGRSVPEAESDAELDRPWHMGDPILEPQGIYQLADGQTGLSRECP